MELVTIITINAVLNLLNIILGGSVLVSLAIGILTLILVDTSGYFKVDKLEGSCKFGILAIIIFVDIIANTLMVLFVTSMLVNSILSIFIGLTLLVTIDVHYFKFR